MFRNNNSCRTAIKLNKQVITGKVLVNCPVNEGKLWHEHCKLNLLHQGHYQLLDYRLILILQLLHVPPD